MGKINQNIIIFIGFLIMAYSQTLVIPSGHDYNFGDYPFLPSFVGNFVVMMLYMVLFAGAFLLPYAFYFYIASKYKKQELWAPKAKTLPSYIAIISAVFYVVKYLFFTLDDYYLIPLNLAFLALAYLPLVFNQRLGNYGSTLFSFFFTYWAFSYAFPF